MHKERKLFYFWLRRSLTRVIFEVGFHQHWTQNSCWASHLVESFELVLDTYDELCGKMPKATIPAQLSLPHVPTAVRFLLISIHYSVCFGSVHYCWSKPVSFSGTPRCLQPWPSCRCCCPSLTSAHNLKEEQKHKNHFDNHLLTVLLWTGNLDSPCLLLGILSLSQPLEVSSSSFFLLTLSKASVVHRWNLFPLYLNSDRVPPGCLFSQDMEWYLFPLKCLTYPVLRYLTWMETDRPCQWEWGKVETWSWCRQRMRSVFVDLLDHINIHIQDTD